MPAVLVQCTSSIAVAQTRATLDGAVLSVPALAAFALAVLAGAVLCAARVAGSLAAGGAGPALLAATASSHAHSVRAAVHRADFI